MPNLLVVHPSLPVRSVQDLINVAKAKPGEILYGSSGNGTGPHLSGELFNLMAHVKLVHIPYKGSPQAMTDLLGGRVMAMFSPASTALPHIKAGTLRALAASSARRTSVAPDLPTVAESGLPGFETSVWFGLLAPAATPRDIIERLNKEVARAIGDGEVKKQFATQGIDAMGGTPEHFATYIREETAKWARVSTGVRRKAGLSINNRAKENVMATAGKVAIVTGAGTGIGKANCTRSVATPGVALALAGRRPEPLTQAVTESGRGRPCSSGLPHRCRQAPTQFHMRCSTRPDKSFGRIDVLFNNAGANAPGIPFEDLTYEKWQPSRRRESHRHVSSARRLLSAS